MIKKTKQDFFKKFLPLFPIAILSLVASLYYLSHNPEHIQIFDDSYITLKFASNFFKYGGITPQFSVDVGKSGL